MDLAIPEDLIACVAPNVPSNAFFLSACRRIPKNPRNKQHALASIPDLFLHLSIVH